MGAIAGVNQLGVDPNPPRCAADASLEYVANPKLLADLPQVDRRVPVAEARVASDHEEFGEAGELGDDVLRDPVAEIVVLASTAQIDERKNSDRRFSLRQGERVGIISGGIFDDIADEPDTLLGQGLDEALTLSVVANRGAHRVDPAAQRRF